MIGMYTLLAVALLAAGAVAGILGILALGIHKEEKDHTFTVTSPSRAASSARRLNGTYVRRPGITQQVLH